MAQVEAPVCFKTHIFKPTNGYVSHCSKKWRKSGNAIFTLVLTVAVEVHGDHGDVVTEVTEGLTSTGAP